MINTITGPRVSQQFPSCGLPFPPIVHPHAILMRMNYGEKIIPHIIPPSAFAPRSIFKASVRIVGTFGGGQRLAWSPCLVLQLFSPISSKLHLIYCRSGSGYWLIVHLILSSKTYIKGRQLRPPLMAQQTAVWQRC